MPSVEHVVEKLILSKEKKTLHMRLGARPGVKAGVTFSLLQVSGHLPFAWGSAQLTPWREKDGSVELLLQEMFHVSQQLENFHQTKVWWCVVVGRYLM